MARKIILFVKGCLLLLISACTGSTGNRMVSPAPLKAASSSHGAPPAQPSTAAGWPMQIDGESLLLWGIEPAQTRHRLLHVKAVYSYGAAGERIDYQQARDWLVQDGLLRRTTGSRLPDFSEYRYSTATPCQQAPLSMVCLKSLRRAMSSGAARQSAQDDPMAFDFLSEPRNPGLTIGYHVYVDYEADIADQLVRARPLLNSGTRRLMCIGDSIVAGAHTVAHFYRQSDADSWCGLLRRQLAPGVEVSNESLPGGELSFLIDNLDSFMARQPDTVVLAFGMNDHLRGAAGLDAFTKGLHKVVDALKRRQIAVLLVGFFQQNPLWRQEASQDTDHYNAALRSVAAIHAVPFVDIAPVFAAAKPGQPAHYLMADFMHHPNNFGQRMYFSQIVPYFLQVDTAASAIPGYVMVGH